MLLPIFDNTGKDLSPPACNLRKYGASFFFILISVFWVCNAQSKNNIEASTEGRPMQIKSLNSRENPMTLSQLRHLCTVPGKCGRPMACEGKWVWVQGVIDYDNVFDQRHYPQLAYEKFRIVSPEDGDILEVFVESVKSRAIFDKIHEQAGKEGVKVIVHGMISGFDMPTMQSCRRGIALILDEPKSIMFNK